MQSKGQWQTHGYSTWVSGFVDTLNDWLCASQAHYGKACAIFLALHPHGTKVASNVLEQERVRIPVVQLAVRTPALAPC